jgi:hypothetical protein
MVFEMTATDDKVEEEATLHLWVHWFTPEGTLVSMIIAHAA